MMRRWHYWRHYLVTGKIFDGETEEMTEMQFLRYLDKWNTLGAGIWQFYSRHVV